jgi:hypothetical protein
MRPPSLILAVPRASGPVFIFCALGHIFGNAEGVGSRFLVLRSRTCFRRCGGRQVPFSYFVHLDSFSVVPSCFHVLLSRTRFRRYRGRQVPFSSYACPDCIESSGPVFMFCAPEYVFAVAAGVGSCFHVLRTRTRFRRYRRRRAPFSCIAIPVPFSAVRRALDTVFRFCMPVLIFGGIEGIMPSFHVWGYRGRRLPISCFALPDSFFCCTMGVCSRFHVLRYRTCYWL